MIIFVRDGEYIFKYEVIVDKEKLEKLKYEVIEKCSIMEHKDYESTRLPTMYGILDYLKYRNYKDIKVGTVEYNDFYSMPETLYRITYDLYHFPYLLELIEKLLNDDRTIIEEIFTINRKKELVSLDIRIKKLNGIIEKIDNINADKKIELLKELSDLLKQKELNKNQENIDKYYIKVRKLITFKKIDILNYSELKRVLDFYDNEIEKRYYIDKKVLRNSKK